MLKSEPISTNLLAFWLATINGLEFVSTFASLARLWAVTLKAIGLTLCAWVFIFVVKPLCANERLLLWRVKRIGRQGRADLLYPNVVSFAHKLSCQLVVHFVGPGLLASAVTDLVVVLAAFKLFSLLTPLFVGRNFQTGVLILVKYLLISFSTHKPFSCFGIYHIGRRL